MGAYLSEPITEKESTDETGNRLICGASSMQGWRVSQEDAHNCIINFDNETSLFAVYDGHGGHEVALYCSQKFPDFLKNVQSYKDGNMTQALIDAFLEFDATIATPEVIAILKELAGEKQKDETKDDANMSSDEEPHEDVNNLYEEASMPLEQVMEKYQNQHLEKLKTNENSGKSPYLRAKKSSRADGPSSSGESSSSYTNGTQNANEVSKDSVEVKEQIESKDEKADKEETTITNGEVNENNDSHNLDKKDAPNEDELKTSAKEELAKTNENDLKTEQKSPKKEGDCIMRIDEGHQEKVMNYFLNLHKNKSVKKNSNKSEKDGETVVDSHLCSNSKEEKSLPETSVDEEQGLDKEEASPNKDESKNTSETSPNKGKGKSKAVKTESPKKERPTRTRKISEEQMRLIYNNILTGQVDKEDSEDSDDEHDDTFKADEVDAVNSSDDEEDDEDEDGEEECWDEEEGETSEIDSESDDLNYMDEDDEDIHMNMTEEPGSDSGCTAVVALLCGNELYVANAGDSRCIVCRNGKVVEMSFDHKPENEEENSRITKAGGKVTTDGRVNGGLNLSRAIGDHAYKQNKELSAKEQMITALPDVTSLTIGDEDEFMVLACDGIWNFMSNEEVADFVGTRLKDGRQKISEICEEMFDHCLAPNTMGDGTGCDNMTAIIVQFKNDKIIGSGGVKRCISSRTASENQLDETPSKRIKIVAVDNQTPAAQNEITETTSAVESITTSSSDKDNKL